MKKNFTFLITKLLVVLVLFFSYSDVNAQANAGLDQEVCTNSTTLNASPPSGYWTVISGSGVFADASLATTSVTGLGLGANTFRWTAPGQTPVSDDVIITNNSVTANAGLDQNICGAYGFLSASPADGVNGETGVWTLVSGGGTILDPTNANSAVDGLLFGTNTFRWTLSKGGCSSFDDANLINDFVPANAGIDGETCDSTFALTANNPSPGFGYWSPTAIGGGFFVNPSANNTTIVSLSGGLSELEWSINYNGCISRDTVAIINNAVVADAGADVFGCSTNWLSALTIEGSWNIVNSPATIVDPSFYSTEVRNLGQGSNVFEWVVTKGACVDRDTVIVYNDSIPADAGIDTTVCSPDNIQLNANVPGPGTGYWSIGTVGYGIFVEPSINNTHVSGLYPDKNVFVWTIDNNGCISSDTVNIFNNSVNVFLEVNSMEVCDSSNVPIMAFQPGPGETGDWLPLNSTVYFDDHTSYTTNVNSLDPGINMITWNLYKGTCSAQDTLRISYFDTTKAGVSDDINLFFDNAMNIDTIVNISAYGEAGTTYGYWTIAQGNATIIDNSINGTVHVVDTSNTIVVGTMGNAACEIRDSILIITGMTFMPMDTVTYLDWANPDAWANGMVPGEDDSVTIFGVNAFIKGDTAKCNSIYISSGSNFEISGGGALYTNTIDLSINNKRFKATGDAQLTIAGDGTLKVGYGETNQKGLRIGTGGILTVKSSPLKATGDGGSLYVRGGSVIIEQDAEKAAGSGGTMYIRGSVIIEQDAEKSLGLKAVSTSSGNNLIVRKGGSVIIEQDAEKSTLAGGLLLVRSGGSIIVGDTIPSTLDSTSALLYVKSGTVNIEKPLLKAAGAGSGTLYVRGGSVIIEQDAEKATYKTEIIAPKTEVYNGQIIIGQLSGVKVVGSGFTTGSIIIEQDAEKSTNVNTSLLIKSGGSLLIDNNLDPNSSFSLSLGANTYTTFEEGSIIDLDYAGTGTLKPIILKSGASLLDMNAGDKLPGIFEHSFTQNLAELFSLPFATVNSSNFTTDASMSLWDENAGVWNPLSSATDFVALDGFKVEYPSMNYNAGLNGTLNSGNISKTLDYSAKSIGGEAGWNLTGNPYPSAIAWDSVATDNISAAVYTYNEQTKQYDVYMKGGLSLNGAVPYLPVGKAFFVRANDANVAFSLTNAVRVHYDFSTPLKAIPSDYLKLAVEGNSYSDEAIIRFLPEASNDYDAQLDAYKLLAEDDAVPQIYSVLQSDESMMAINTLTPPGNQEITVPLNLKATVDGTYKISVKEINFDPAVSVVLKDLKNNTTQDLKANPVYSFDYVSGDPENRFEIQFGAGITSIESQNPESLDVDIFANANSVNIRTFDNKDYRYEIYDIKGKMIKQDKLYIKGLNTIALNVQQGVYIVKVITGNQTYSKQIAIVK